MAETLRDLVVSLSLNSDNFSANLRSINAQLKEADSAFKLAAAGEQNFENTTAGCEQKLSMLQQKLQLQQQAVQQYEQALQKAQDRLQTSVDAHDKLAAKLEEAKQKHTDLGTQIVQLTERMEQARAAGEEGTEGYAQMEQQLQTLQQEYQTSGEEISRMEQQLRRSEATMQRNADGVTRAQTNLNNANAALRQTSAEIDQTTSRLERMRNGWLNAADHIASFGEKAVAAGKKIEGIGKELSKVSAAVAAMGAAAVKTFASFDDSIRQVYATMGLSAAENEAEMEALSAAAQEMGSTTRYSASEAASALNYLALAGYDADQAIEALPTVLNLAQAGGIDLASASDMVTDSMSALGLEMSYMPKFADQLAKASQKSNTSVGQLGEGILKIGGTAANLKGGTVELSTALGILADNGIKGAEGGTHLRNVLLSLQNPTDAAAEQLQAFGIKVYDTDGKLRGLDEIFGDLSKSMAGMTDEAKDAAISAIFNKTDLTAVNALLSNSGARWRELSGEIENCEGAAQGMADMMEGGIGGAFRSLKSAVEGLAIAYGEVLAPTVQAVADKIREYVTRFTEMDESHKKTIVTIGAVVAAAGPVLMIVGKVITVIGKVAIGLSKLMKWLAAGKGAIAGLAGGISAGTAVVAGLGAALVVGTAFLIDWATGAKAAREAQAQLNETVKEWGENATTAYEKSKGLAAFGLTAENFNVGAKKALDSESTWLEEAIKIWADGKKETDEIVNDTVKGFTDGSDEIRSSLSGLSGGEGFMGDLDGDLSRLDEIDAEVASIFKKRQNGFLTDADKARLQELIDERGAIQVKYQLVSDASDGFEQIQQGVESALSRGADPGDVWADSYAAASQGIQAFTDSLNAEYDAQYKNIQAMEDGAEKEKALGELQTWYAEQKAAGEQAYADTLAKTAQQTGVFEDGGQYDGTIDKLNEVNAALEALDAAQQSGDKNAQAAALDQLNAAMEGMDESSLVEVAAGLQSIGDNGGTMSEQMQGAYDALSQLKELMSGGEDLFGDSWETVNNLFGEGLDSEVLEIHASLGTDALSSQYDAWAAGEHADIIPPLKPEALDASTIQVVGTTAAVKVPGTLSEVELEDGKTYLVTGDGVKVATGDLQEAVLEDGKTYLVTGDNVKVATGELQQVTLKNGEQYIINEDGVVIARGKLQEAVLDGGKTYIVDQDGVKVASGSLMKVTLDGKEYLIDEEGAVVAKGGLEKVTLGGKTYLVDESGVTVKTGRLQEVTLGGETYVIDEDGVVVGKGKLQTAVLDDGKTYLVTGDGVKVSTGKLLKVELDDTEYLVSGDGVVVATGKLREATLDDGRTYIVDGNNVIVKTGKVEQVTLDNGKSYIINQKGVVVASGDLETVKLADGKEYLVDGGGNVVATGELFDVTLPSGKTITVDAAGAVVVTGATIDLTDGTSFNTSRGKGPTDMFEGSGAQVNENEYENVPLLGMITTSDAEAVSAYAAAIGEYNAAIANGGDAADEAYAMQMSLPGGTDFNNWASAGTRAADAAKYISSGLRMMADGSLTDEDSAGLQSYLQNLVAIGEYNPNSLDSIADALDGMDTAGEALKGLDGEGLTELLAKMVQVDPNDVAESAEGAATEAVEAAADAAADAAQGAEGAELPMFEMSGDTDEAISEIQRITQGIRDLYAAGDAGIAEGGLGSLGDTIADLTDADLEGMASRAESLITALGSGQGTAEEIAAWEAELAGLQEVFSTINPEIDLSKFTVGDDIVAGLIGPLQAGVEAAQTSGQALGAASVEGVAAGAQTHSPSAATTQTGQDVLAGLVQGMSNTGSVTTAGTAAGSAAINAVRAAMPSSALYSAGLQVMQGMANGIRAGQSAVVSAIVAAASAAVAAAKAALQISSPSKVFENEVGAMVMRGFGKGVADEVDEQARVIANAARYLTGEAQAAVAGGSVTNNRSTYNQQSSVSFDGATFVIRDENDARSLAVDIAELTNRSRRGTGGGTTRRV